MPDRAEAGYYARGTEQACHPGGQGRGATQRHQRVESVLRTQADQGEGHLCLAGGDATDGEGVGDGEEVIADLCSELILPRLPTITARNGDEIATGCCGRCGRDGRVDGCAAGTWSYGGGDGAG